MEQVRNESPKELATRSFVFEDKRVPEMLFRYRARNFPDSLSPEEQAQWEEYRFARLTEPEAGGSICMEEFQVLIEELLAADDLPEAKQALLQQLLVYGDSLLA
jgi:exodeoxyribonuclease-1